MTKSDEFASPEKQEARAFLRERFLRLVSSVTDLDCTLHLFDKTSVTAKFGGPDIDFLKLFVTDLDTPSFKHPQALIRTSDILSIEIPKASCQKLIPDDDAEMKEIQNGV